MRIVPLGGAEEIGASCTFVELGGRRLVVDCGIRTGARAGDDPLPNLSFLSDLGGVDAILITHAHLDHIGALPVLHQAFPSAPVYATPPTHALLRVMLGDALKVMADRSERENEVPLYSAEAVQSLVTRCLPVRFCERTPILGGDVTVTLFPAGHVLGAAMVGLEGSDGRVLVTGDYSVSAQRTVEGLMAPRFLPDIVVTECTYGDRLHANRAVEERRLAETVAGIVAGGGKALVPAFALGRAQEVVLILQQFQRDGVIPPFPIWIDGMVKNICGVYTGYAESLSRSFRRRQEREGNVFFRAEDGCNAVSPPRREEVANGPPCAVVASSGMLTGGPSLFYARRLAEDERSAILITGYQDEESPGRRLLDLARASAEERTLTVDGQSVRVACRVEKYALSAHADSGEVAGLMSRLAPADVVLVHGGDDARGRLAALVGAERRVHLPSACDELTFATPARRTLHAAVAPRRKAIGHGRALDLEALRDALVAEGEEKAVFTAEELAERWYGASVPAERIAEVRAALETANPFLGSDRKRPYLYRVQRGDRPPDLPSGLPLEQNLALGVVAELFADCPELYRKGAMTEQKVLALSFHFPRVAQARWSDRLAAVAERTGWSVSVVPEAHAGALATAVQEVLPEGWGITKQPSYYREENRVVVRATLPPQVTETDLERVRAAYETRTGVRLEIASAGPGTPLPATFAVASGQPMEINSAYAQVERILGAALLRRGRKVDAASGGAYIELAFISPEVGERFRPQVEDASRIVGWPLRICPEPNQNAIKDRVRQLVPAAWGLTKEPGFFRADRKVRIRLRTVPDAAPLAEVSARLEAETGYRLEAEQA